MIVERLTSPSTPVVSPAHLSEQARVTDAVQEAELVRMAAAVAVELEHYAQIALLDQTIRVTLECWPRADTLPLPIAPVVNALSVKVTAEGVAYDAFAVVTGQRPSIRKTGDRPTGVVVIEYQAGFGSVASDVPPDLAHAILDQAAALFDMRGTEGGKVNGMSAHMQRIAARYRRVAL